MLAHSWFPRNKKKFSGYLILYASSRQIVSKLCFPETQHNVFEYHTKFEKIIYVGTHLCQRSLPGTDSWPREGSLHTQTAGAGLCIGRGYHLKRFNLLCDSSRNYETKSPLYALEKTFHQFTILHYLQFLESLKQICEFFSTPCISMSTHCH